MELRNLQNKRIAVLGLGIENYALVKFLLKYKVKCEMTIFDARDKESLGENYQRLLRRSAPRNDIRWQLGKNNNRGLEKFDIFFRSPGWPLHKFSIFNFQFSKKIYSAIRLFIELCPSKNIIGVTGTKGKGTTASLIYEILKKRFERAITNGAQANAKRRQTWLGGNIGIAPFEFLDKIKKGDWVVLELSSFQLQDMKISPHIAVITNLTSEHLAPADPNNPNYHKTLKEYWQAKMNIAKWQKKDDCLILNSKFQTLNSKQISNFKFQISKKQIKSKIIFFSKSNFKSHLVGGHNKENIAAAVEVAKIVGVKLAIIKKAVANFKGLEHRLELVKSVKGVKYYNDSFATTPESTIIALKSFTAPLVLIAGGAEKKSDFKILAKEMKKHVKYVVLLDGQATLRIKKELLKVKYPFNKMKLARNMKQAVKMARHIAVKNEIVLLSPACASFGMFKNYKERGQLFKDAVSNLK